jgi:hypothetical protein
VGRGHFLHHEFNESILTMTTVKPLGLICLIFLACSWAWCPSLGFAEDLDSSVTVELASGRQFTGQLHPRSDADRLWLRFGRDTAYILRPIDWDRVAWVRVAGERIPLAEFKRQAIELECVGAIPAATSPSVAPLPQPVSPPASSRRLSGDLPVAERANAGTPRNQYTGRTLVASIVVDAWVANWDRDVENDGLVVFVVPLDVHGYAVAASGSLQVYLIGPRLRRFQEAPRSRGSKLDRLGCWVKAVHESDFREGGFAYRLPFQAIHPEFDNRLGSHAMVNVKLTVPGSGTFERTIDYVRIQPFSPIRDYHQLRTGHRWLDIEQTGRGKPATGQPWYSNY